ncbi:hypothetical protein Rctr16k_18 [Virus Rctr16k]|nr:hypothetical protein Rctr16k_18 [Virus Rctr16k]
MTLDALVRSITDRVLEPARFDLSPTLGWAALRFGAWPRMSAALDAVVAHVPRDFEPAGKLRLAAFSGPVRPHTLESAALCALSLTLWNGGQPS